MIYQMPNDDHGRDTYRDRLLGIEMSRSESARSSAGEQKSTGLGGSSMPRLFQHTFRMATLEIRYLLWGRLRAGYSLRTVVAHGASFLARVLASSKQTALCDL